MSWKNRIQLQLTATEVIAVLAALETMRPSSELELAVIADTLSHVQTAYDNFKKRA